MTAPRDLARLLQLAEIVATDRVLIVGAARGYTTAVVAELAASVVALEVDADLTAAATTSLAGTTAAASIIMVSGPLSDGVPDRAPFDVIFIDGAIGDLPASLASQLAPGGRIVCVMIDGGVGRATLFTKARTNASVELPASSPLNAGTGLARRFVFEASAVPLPGLVPIVKPFKF